MSEEQKPIEVTDRTKFTVNSIGVIALIGGVLTLASIGNAILNKLDDMETAIHQAAVERWRADDMERWAYAFERLNADKGLKLPNTRDPLIRVREQPR